jgi:prevent-host-death family protein
MKSPVIINVHEAKTHFSKLLDRAHAGEELVLAKAGVPYARLMPLASPPTKRQFGRLAATPIDDSLFFESLPKEELDAWGQG